MLKEKLSFSPPVFKDSCKHIHDHHSKHHLKNDECLDVSLKDPTWCCTASSYLLVQELLGVGANEIGGGKISPWWVLLKASMTGLKGDSWHSIISRIHQENKGEMSTQSNCQFNEMGRGWVCLWICWKASILSDALTRQWPFVSICHNQRDKRIQTWL